MFLRVPLAFAVACVLLFLATPHTPARAQSANAERIREQVNANVVTLISGSPNGSFLFTAHDIASVVGRYSDLRVLPIVGKGGAQNIRDILYLRGIDMGIVHPHLIKYYARTGELGANLDRRIAYVTPLFADELHLIASDNIGSIQELAGKPVNFGEVGGDTQITLKIVLDMLGIKVEEVNLGQGEAFEKIKAGELAATFCSCAKPLVSVRLIEADAGLHLLPVPYTDAMAESFLPAFLAHEDYPALIPPGQEVETIAVQTVLGVFNWSSNNPRYPTIVKFVNALFSNIDKFHQPPRQPKWRSVNIAADVNSMIRYAPAQQWIDDNIEKLASAATAAAVPSAIDERLARRQAEVAAPGDPAMQRRLFQEFMAWMRRREAGAPAANQ